MTTDVTNPRGATGPRTEAGKAISARNSTKHGLFAKRDFILEGEDEEYAETFSALMAELSPAGVLEQTFATEIMGANWRLRRCGILEFNLARSADPQTAIQPSAIEQSIDRARSQSHTILRRSLAELRKLQTERHALILMTPDAEAPTDLALTDSSSFCKPPEPAPSDRSSFRNEPTGSSFCNPPESPLAEIEAQLRRKEKQFEAFCEGSSFCKSSAATPRNAPCPCGSGAKYKRCCGKNAPPVLNTGAQNRAR